MKTEVTPWGRIVLLPVCCWYFLLYAHLLLVEWTISFPLLNKFGDENKIYSVFLTFWWWILTWNTWIFLLVQHSNSFHGRCWSLWFDVRKICFLVTIVLVVTTAYIVITGSFGQKKPHPMSNLDLWNQSCLSDWPTSQSSTVCPSEYVSSMHGKNVHIGHCVQFFHEPNSFMPSMLLGTMGPCC